MDPALRLPCLYPITDRALCDGRSHAAIVALLCRGGATLIQLREKSMEDGDLLREARAAIERAREDGARVILNDRADIAVMAGAAGVHVGDEDLPPEAARAILGPGALVGRSTHSVAEARAAAAGPVDYVALGPVFATAHASVTREPLGVEAVAQAASSIDRPLVVVGGIDLERARELLDAGAASVAVLGDLMTARDLPGRVAAYLALRP